MLLLKQYHPNVKSIIFESDPIQQQVATASNSNSNDLLQYCHPTKLYIYRTYSSWVTHNDIIQSTSALER